MTDHSDDDRLESMIEANDILKSFYSPDKTELLNDPPIDSLIRAILSQNTNDRNRDVAFDRLKKRFANWEEAADASPDEILIAIRSSNHSPTKSRRIHAILRRLRDDDALSMDFIRRLSDEEAMEKLTEMEGVGKKTAACVLMFAFDRPIMPVDTHIFRTASRLGWISPRISKDAAHDRLNEITPKDLRYSLHLGLWEHGRNVCRPTPRCASCAIRHLCAYELKTTRETALSSKEERHESETAIRDTER